MCQKLRKTKQFAQGHQRESRAPWPHCELEQQSQVHRPPPPGVPPPALSRGSFSAAAASVAEGSLEMWRLSSTQVTTVQRIMSSQPMKMQKMGGRPRLARTQHLPGGRSQLFCTPGPQPTKRGPNLPL